MSFFLDYLLFKLMPILVLRAGFGFTLPKFMVIAYVLLLQIIKWPNMLMSHGMEDLINTSNKTEL